METNHNRDASTGVGPDGVDPKLLARIRGLLAKAEATNYPAEAEAFTTKAQELMARHSIDVALLDRGDPAGRGGAVSRMIDVTDPYATPKATLLTVVAHANHGDAVWNRPARVMTVFGFPVDVTNIELLYTSLLVQATRAMTAAGRDVDGSGRSRTRSFRSSFLLAFAYRIGERLRDATQQATAEAAADLGESLLPVLARRDEAVAEARHQAFPRVRAARSSTVTNPGGWRAGRVAADAARLPRGTPLASGR